MGILSGRRKKGSMLHAITWMSLENFIISKDTRLKGQFCVCKMLRLDRAMELEN